MWTESEIIQEFRYKTGEFKNLIQRRDWNELFIRHQHINPFETYWRELLAEIVDLKRKNSDERTLLMIAVNDYGCNVVKILLERGADVTETTRYNIGWMHSKDSTGWTALHYAAAINGFCNIIEATSNTGNIEAIKLLLEYEANIDATDDSEETPLMWAVKASSACALKFLLTRGARLDLKNNDGHTALDIAKLYRHQAYSKLFRNEYKKTIEFLETQQK
jgi:ankyrin repeat protein